jgi:hypothetical protein
VDINIIEHHRLRRWRAVGVENRPRECVPQGVSVVAAEIGRLLHGPVDGHLIGGELASELHLPPKRSCQTGRPHHDVEDMIATDRGDVDRIALEQTRRGQIGRRHRAQRCSH